jgi:hypothetical protein
MIKVSLKVINLMTRVWFTDTDLSTLGSPLHSRLLGGLASLACACSTGCLAMSLVLMTGTKVLGASSAGSFLNLLLYCERSHTYTLIKVLVL